MFDIIIEYDPYSFPNFWEIVFYAWVAGTACYLFYYFFFKFPRDKAKHILIPNLNTLADVIDRLIVEVNKLSFFENKKREEHGKPDPNPELIAQWDNLSRECCEYRSMLKNEINRLMTNIVKSREYKTLRELRTFRKPALSIGELLENRCQEVSDSLYAGALEKTLEFNLVGDAPSPDYEKMFSNIMQEVEPKFRIEEEEEKEVKKDAKKKSTSTRRRASSRKGKNPA